MRRIVCLIAFCLMCSFAVAAQDQDSTSNTSSTPKADAFIGYTYVRATYKNGILPYNVPYSMEGGMAQFAFYPTKILGIVAEISGTGASTIGGNPAGGGMYTYLFGPRFSFRRNHRLHFYVQGLFGIAHMTPGLNYYLLATDANGALNGTGIAASGGVGVEYRLTKHWGVRVAQLDYLMTRFYDPFGSRFIQGNYRYSGGVVFSF